MVSHNNNQPLINIKQPTIQAEQPKMQTIFHYRKPNRNKLNKTGTKNELDEQLSEEPKGKIDNEIKPEKLNFEIIEPVSKQSTNFTLFDLSQDPDRLIRNLMDSISNPDSSFDLNAVFKNSEQQLENNEIKEIEVKAVEIPNMYESLSVLEMAHNVLQGILENQLKGLDVIDNNDIKSGPVNYFEDAD